MLILTYCEWIIHTVLQLLISCDSNNIILFLSLSTGISSEIEVEMIV